MNTDVMFSSASDMWETPQNFFDKLDQEFHYFGLPGRSTGSYAVAS